MNTCNVWDLAWQYIAVGFALWCVVSCVCAVLFALAIQRCRHK